ncbi:hypothetical protein WJX73_005704 [Symbiochloris irregularis]|uniref:DUF305 domain-containing protein n=1 Tax=Symbiochloris irregularis TaxID=706552 RepID=A0AAW1NKG7_9CHLO
MAPAPAPRSELTQIMDTTMANMMAVPACNSVDRTFTSMMIVHHQGAVRMAQWASDGTDSSMTHGDSASMGMGGNMAGMAPAAESPGEAAMMNSDAMMMAMPPSAYSPNVNIAYATQMRAHHQAAIDMAKVDLQYGSNAQLLTLAREIIASQDEQVQQFSDYLAEYPSTQ